MQTLRPTVSIDEADNYFSSVLHSEDWNVTREQKEQALTYASVIISSAFEFSSEAYQTDDNGEIIWSDPIKAAVFEEARYLLMRNPAEIPAGLLNGISQASAGSVSATFDWSFVLPWICGAAKTLVGSLGTFIADGSGYCRSQLLAM